MAILGTVKQILDEFAARVNLPQFTSYVGQTSPAQLQYMSLYKFIGDNLLNRPYQWPQLKRQQLFVTQTNVRSYKIPNDFYRLLGSTPFDTSHQRPMRGPLSDFNYAVRTQAVVSLQTRKAYQIIGSTNGILHSRVQNEITTAGEGYFRIDPPGASEIDFCSFGYISQTWTIPPAWAKSTIYTSPGSYVSSNGTIYSAARSGPNSSGTGLPPTVVNGFGSDGGALWLNIVIGDTFGSGVWVGSTPYTVGQYTFTSTGKYYICTVGGTSGGVEPTSTATAVTDGSVTWKYLPTTPWAANTQYSFGKYVTQSITIPGGATSTQLYMCAAYNAAETISGTTAPCWYWNAGNWFSIDGSTYWLQNQGYTSIISDSDLCLFDKDLMIEGIRWAYFRSKKQDYQTERNDWEQMVKGAFGRFEGPEKSNMADELGDYWEDGWPNAPAGSWDVG